MNARALAASLALLAPAVAACTSEPGKQWYKPGGDYTVAEFQRDEKACTRSRTVDDDCMRARGWVPLSGDIGKKQNLSNDPRDHQPKREGKRIY